METISFDEMSTLDVPSAALRSSLDKIASALQKVGAAGTDASAAVDELRTSLRAAAAPSMKSWESSSGSEPTRIPGRQRWSGCRSW